MTGAGTTGKIAAAVLALGIGVGAIAAHAQDSAKGNSWEPVSPAPAASPAPAKPDQQLPKEPGDTAAPTRSWAPPDLATPAQPGEVPGQVCRKSDFEAVVDEAASALRDLNLQNKPAFQEKLRQLKDKRGWSHDVFLQEAAPYVRDDKIAVYDQQSEQLLSDISSLGQEGAEAPTPDCALLADLKARMKRLVDAQTAKWAYMFQKLDTALKQ